MPVFYTYLWLREDGTPYYAGKGSGVRAFVRDNHRVPCPPKDRVLIQEFDSETDAFEAEKFLIAFYGRKDVGTGCLRNMTDGGENPPRAKKGTGLGKKYSEEHNKAISDALKGKPKTREHREALSRVWKPRNIVFSDDARKKISASLIGNKRGQGVERSAAYKQKMSEAITKWWASRKGIS